MYRIIAILIAIWPNAAFCSDTTKYPPRLSAERREVILRIENALNVSRSIEIKDELMFGWYEWHAHKYCNIQSITPEQNSIVMEFSQKALVERKTYIEISRERLWAGIFLDEMEEIADFLESNSGKRFLSKLALLPPFSWNYAQRLFYEFDRIRRGVLHKMEAELTSTGCTGQR